MNRKYELVYVVSPDATDEQVTELHTQVESIVQRMNGQIEKTENWGRRKLAYEIGRHKEGTYVLEVINGDRRADEGNRPSPEGDRSGHPPSRRSRGRGAGCRRADARRAAPRRSRRRRVARGLPPDRQPGEGQRGEPMTIVTTALTWRGGTAMNGRKRFGGGGGGGRGKTATGQQGKDGQRRPMFRRRKVCKFCSDKIDDINYKDVKLLMPFVPERAKVLPRRISGTCALHQRKLRTAIMRARQLALIPYTTE